MLNEIELLLYHCLHFILYVIIMFAGGAAIFAAILATYILGASWWLPFSVAGGNDMVGKEIAFGQYTLPFIVQSHEITPLNFTIEIAFVNSLMISIGFLMVFVFLCIFLYALQIVDKHYKNQIYAISHKNIMQNPPTDNGTEIGHEEVEKCQKEVDKNKNEVFKESVIYMWTRNG